MKEIQISELPDLLRRDPCLVVGPGVETHSTIEDDLYENFALKYGKAVPSKKWLELTDELIAGGIADSAAIRSEVIDFYKVDRPEGVDAESVAKASWRSVVSLGFNLSLHKKIKELLDMEPSGWQLATITDPQAAIALNTLPYFALLGDSREIVPGRRVCVSGAEYLARRRMWPRMLAPLGDFIKNDPVIFLGTSCVVDRVIDFIDALLSLYPRCPTRFIFLKSDECVRSSRIQNLLSEFGEILVIDATIRDIARTVSRDHRDIYDLPIFSYREVGPISFEELRIVSDFCIPVPPKAALQVNAAERRKNLNALFQSSSHDWAPFELGLNFVRDYEAMLYSYIETEWASIPPIMDILGEAGCGKSVAIKSVAYKLANTGYLVVWLKRGFGEISGNNLSILSAALVKAIRKSGTRILVVIDDPIACGFNPGEVCSILRSVSLDWRVLVCKRKTDLIGRPSDSTVKSPLIEFPERFTDGEWSRLPAYLVSIGVSLTMEIAERDLARVPGSAGSDVLCALWYLLPQTRDILSNSLSNEYFRLGGLETTIERIARSVSGESATVVKNAYEFVSVCAGLDRTPVPVEVLVGALGVTYAEWSNQCEKNRPVWGLLTEEFFGVANTYVYRNRNVVVTTVLLRLINGPDGSHSGEFRIFKTLLSACISGQPQYVEFIKWILVERREALEGRFNLDQITELYDVAIKACPVRLGIVEHHRAIARSHKGARPMDVHQELMDVLKKAGSVRGENEDAVENIHTSAAAALVRAIQNGEADPLVISKNIFAHIEKALGNGKINWHAYHTHAKSLIELAVQTKDSSPKFAWKCNMEASQISERAILLLEPIVGAQGKLANDREFFKEIRNKIILSVGDIGELRASADLLFENGGDQSAYALVVRIMASSAAREDRNSEYKKVDDYIRLIGSRIVNSGAVIDRAITAARVENEFKWKVIKGSTSSYDIVAALRDVRNVMDEPAYGRDIMWNFMAAVLAYFNRSYSDSDAIFVGLRRMFLVYEVKNAVRCYIRNSRGLVHVFEGRISSISAPRVFIYSPELETDVMGYVGEFGSLEGKTVHFNLGFTTNGPLASKPTAS